MEKRSPYTYETATGVRVDLGHYIPELGAERVAVRAAAEHRKHALIRVLRSFQAAGFTDAEIKETVGLLLEGVAIDAETLNPNSFFPTRPPK